MTESFSKAYEDLPDSEVEAYLDIALHEFTAEQLIKLTFWKLAVERGLV